MPLVRKGKCPRWGGVGWGGLEVRHCLGLSLPPVEVCLPYQSSRLLRRDGHELHGSRRYQRLRAETWQDVAEGLREVKAAACCPW